MWFFWLTVLLLFTAYLLIACFLFALLFDGLRRRLWPWALGKHEALRSFVEIIAIVVAGSWALYNFVYVEDIKPQREPPKVHLTAEMQVVGRSANLVAVRATVKAQNPSKGSMSVLAAYYNVEGVKLTPRGELSNQEYQNYVGQELAAQLARNRDTEASRFTGPPNVEAVFSSNLMQGWKLDPEDQYSRSTVFYVPAGRFDHLTLRFDIYVVKDEGYETYVHPQWAGGESGYLRAQFFAKRGGHACDQVRPESNCDQFAPHKNPAHRALRERLGLTHYDAITGVSLWLGAQGQPEGEEEKP